MKVIAYSLVAAAALVAASPAIAADLSVGPVQSAATPPPAKSVIDTIGIEISPEWGAVTPNAYRDSVLKLSWAHSLGKGWTWGASIADTFKSDGSTYYQPETTLGYKWKADAWTLGVSAGLGYISTGGIAAAVADGYYVLNATADLKLSSQWTWNAISARYRNAFAHTWVTPKLSTGFTYTIDGHNSTYANVGYSWKDSGAGLAADKISLALGYKYGF